MSAETTLQVLIVSGDSSRFTKLNIVTALSEEEQIQFLSTITQKCCSIKSECILWSEFSTAISASEIALQRGAENREPEPYM